MELHNRWWSDAYRPRKSLSKEMIFRRSMKKTLKEYMKHSSLSGCKYVVDPHLSKKEKSLWLLWLLVTTFIFGYAMRTTWQDVLSKPLVVSIESTVYAIEHVDFPAVALCNVNRISKKAAKELAKELFPVANYTLDDIEKHLYGLGHLIDFDVLENSEMFHFFEQLPEDIPTELWIERMKKLAPNCNDLLIRCRWAGKVQPCKELFTLRRTSHGHCCVFNYILDYNNLGRPKRMEREVERQKIPGAAFGLSVVMDPQVHDYGYRLHDVEGVDVLFYSPLYFADHNNGPLIHHIAHSNTELYIELRSRVQLATDEVRKYAPSVRKCYFHDEMQEEFGNTYSYGTCIVNCRTQAIQSLCKCTPYFLPVPRNSGPVCTIADLKCLNKYKEKILLLYPIDPETTEGLEEELEDSSYCIQCLPDCERTKHATRASSIPIPGYDSNNYLQYAFLFGLNLTNKSILNVYYPTPGATLDRLDAVYYWYELLSNFGGTAGVLLGYSVISSMEWIYFTTIRFITILSFNFALNNVF